MIIQRLTKHRFVDETWSSFVVHS